MLNTVMIVGCSLESQNGVAKNTQLLLKNLPYAEHHSVVQVYSPKWKWFWECVVGVVGYLYRMIHRTPRVVQAIVGAPGDAIRTLPYIVFGKLRGCKVSLHFRHNRATILGRLPCCVRPVVVGAWRLADGYCFLSPRLRDEFIGILPKKRLWTVIPNGIASDWLDAETAASCERQQDIVFLGRWSAQKGVDDLVATMDSLDIGRTAECDVYSDYLFKFEPNGCRFHPWLDERGVKAVLRNAKVLLLPSHAEGFPNVLVQAAACGTPFVATRLAGVMDIVEESGAGLLCEVGDIGQLQTAVRTLLADASTWSDCSRNGRHWAESLSIARVAKLWHRYYAELGIDMSRYETHCDGENRPTCTCSKRMTGVAPL